MSSKHTYQYCSNVLTHHFHKEHLYWHCNHGCQAMPVIEDVLVLLEGYIPNLLIGAIGFLGESAYPLIQRVRSLAFSSDRSIPILVTSVCSLISLAQQLTVKVEAYLHKSIDINGFIDQVQNLSLASSSNYPPSIQSWVIKTHLIMLRFGTGVR